MTGDLIVALVVMAAFIVWPQILIAALMGVLGSLAVVAIGVSVPTLLIGAVAAKAALSLDAYMRERRR
jgi:hypothetical protein